jgi:hypothetical protein
VPYPVACSQAWAAGAIPYMMETMLGLRAAGLDRRLDVMRPGLRRWVTRVDLTGIRLSGAGIDLGFERAPDRVRVSDVRVGGDARHGETELDRA